MLCPVFTQKRVEMRSLFLMFWNNCGGYRLAGFRGKFSKEDEVAATEQLKRREELEREIKLSEKKKLAA